MPWQSVSAKGYCLLPDADRSLYNTFWLPPLFGFFPMLKDFVLSFWEAYPDVRHIPLQDIFLSPEQTKMAHRFTMTGRMLGQLPPGFTPTGRRFEIDGLEMIEFRKVNITDRLKPTDQNFPRLHHQLIFLTKKHLCFQV